MNKIPPYSVKVKNAKDNASAPPLCLLWHLFDDLYLNLVTEKWPSSFD